MGRQLLICNIQIRFSFVIISRFGHGHNVKVADPSFLWLPINKFWPRPELEFFLGKSCRFQAVCGLELQVSAGRGLARKPPLLLG